MLAAKFFDDQYFNNAYYAKVGGVPAHEVRRSGRRVRKRWHGSLPFSFEPLVPAGFTDNPPYTPLPPRARRR